MLLPLLLLLMLLLTLHSMDGGLLLVVPALP